MSIKTLSPSMKPLNVLSAARIALQRTALAAAVGVLMLAPVASHALELGEATIVSGLGQSLLVEIPYRLSAGEQLAPACIGLAPALRPAGALPAYTRASRVTITPTHIEIFGDSRVLEPLIGLNVDVRCESVPRFVRSYELFVDPPVRTPASSSGSAPRPVVANASADTAAPRPVVATNTAPAGAETAPSPRVDTSPRASASPRARGQAGGTLTQGDTYVVVRGDTLSGIASRVRDRLTIRETAEAIFAANASAFTRGNRDLLEAGRSITIPVMTAAPIALPAAPAAAPAVSEVEPPASLPSADVRSAPSSSAPPSAASTPSAVTPAAVEPRPPAPAPAAAEPSAAPTQIPTSAAADASSVPTSGRSSLWLTALLALGAVVLLSAPVVFLRRRKDEPAAPVPAKARPARPRQLVDPIAGFDVVEGDMPRTPTVKIENPVAPKRAEAPAVSAEADAPDYDLHMRPTDSLDLDVGTPVADERVDWFSDRVDAAAATVATPAVTPVRIGADATAQLPEVDRTATLRQPSPERDAEVADPTLDDKQHTLTIVELDMLRQDYETEHTLTQQTNKELQEALADLKATQAARASNGDTATMEMPQHAQAEDLESQPTRKLRSLR